MIPRNQMAAIHIAKGKANLNDADYRAVLQRVAGVNSCKDLDCPQAVNAVLAELNKLTVERKGWKYSQLQKFKQYARLCRIGVNEARELLYKTVGMMNEESPQLSQTDFDDFMAAIESKLEALVNSGRVSVPQYIKLEYWRNRHPNQGQVNTRESHKIYEIWSKLEKLLSQEKRNMNYLLGFVANTCRFKHIMPVENLSSRQALKVIDALKKRLAQEENKLKTEVPF